MSDPRQGMTSASNALADTLCKARFLMQQGIAEPEPSEDAKSGELIHAALANSSDRSVMMALSLAQREMFDACRSLEQKLVIDYFGEQPPSPIRVIRETPDGSARLWVRFTHEGKPYAHSGQPDAIFRCGTRALVIEYKTGANDVPESPDNLQLRDQAVLVYGNHTLLEEIATAVVQPLAGGEPKITVYDKPALIKAQMEMYARVVESNKPGQTPTPGEKQCAFCLAKTKCVPYQQWASQATPLPMLKVMDVPMVNWTPEQRAAAAAAIAPAAKFIEELKEFLKEGISKDPSFVPGWRLKPGAVKESIRDPQICFDRFAAACSGATNDPLKEFMGTISVGKTKLRETMARCLKLKGKALDKAIDQITEGIVEAKQNAPSLARAEE